MKRRMKWFLYAVFVLAGALPLRAGHTLRGTVANASGKAVETATVQIIDRDKTIAYAFTDARGDYVVTYETDAPQIRIVVSHLSYEKHTALLDVGDRRHDVRLRDKNKALQEVVVKAPEVYQRGDTLSYRLSAFTGAADYTLSDALKKLPGVEVSDEGAIKYLGKDISDFYIEGLDLLGGKYNMATQNLPASYVTSVQVINNHQPVKVDEAVFSDDVAINIKLSKHAKLRPVGTYEATVGRGDKTRYYLAGAGMLFNPNFQLLATMKLGNTKEFAGQENVDHFADDAYTPYALAVLGELTAAHPPIKRERYISPQDHALSLNLIQKLKPQVTLKTNVGYAHTRTGHSYASEQVFPNGAGDITITQQYAPDANKHLPFLSMEYKDNGAKRYIINNLTAGASILDASLPMSDGTWGALLQREKYRGGNVENRFSVRWKSEKLRWGISSFIRYNRTPEGRIEISTKDGERLMQKATSSHALVRTTLSATYETRVSRLYLPLTVGYGMDQVTTALQYDTITAENLLDGMTLHWHLSPQYEYTHPLRRFIFRGGASLGGVFSDYTNRGSRPSAYRRNRWTASPSLYFYYALSPQSIVRLQGAYTEKDGDLSDLLTAPVRNRLTTERRGIGRLAHSRTLSVQANYDFKLPLEMLFLYVGASYVQQRNTLLPSMEISPRLIEATSRRMPHLTHNASAYFGITKQFQPIETKASFNAGFTHGRHSMIQNDRLYNYRLNTIWLNPTIVAKPFDGRLELAYSYRFVKTYNRIDNGRDQSHLSQTHDIRLHVQPAPKWLLTATSDITTEDQMAGRPVTATLFDLGATYRHRALRLSLDLRNLFNLQHYSYSLFNAVNTYSYSYRLRGRELWLTVSITK